MEGCPTVQNLAALPGMETLFILNASSLNLTL
jgi:hypothetical protein